MDASRETWDAEEHPQTQTIFYAGGAGGPTWQSSNGTSSQVFYSTLSEELKDVSARTIEAFEYALALDWDFLARPNSSCYVNKANLVAYLETLPRPRQLRGLLAFAGVGTQLLWGGGQYILSRDVVEEFVQHKAAWRRELMEDEAITRMAEVLEIPMLPGRSATIDLHPNGHHLCTCYGHGDSFAFTDYAEVAEKAAGHHFFRVKNDADRSVDVKVMRELKRVLP